MPAPFGNESRLKKPSPSETVFFCFLCRLSPFVILHRRLFVLLPPPLACGCAGMKMEGADILSDVGSFRMNGAR